MSEHFINLTAGAVAWLVLLLAVAVPFNPARHVWVLLLSLSAPLCVLTYLWWYFAVCHHCERWRRADRRPSSTLDALGRCRACQCLWVGYVDRGR